MNDTVASKSSWQAGHIPGLDGIRALAIGLVLFSHSVTYGSFTHLASFGLVAGPAGVAVFFVLSGFLITNILLREEERTGCISLRLFYLRRALRLFPALWLYLLVVSLIWLAGYLPHHPWHSFVSSLLYVRNLVGRGHETDHLWSLSIEEQFYLLWPLVLVALPGRNRLRLFIGLGALSMVTLWRVLAARTGLASAGAMYIRSDFRFDAPMFGCVLALVLRVAPKVVSWSNATAMRSSLLAIIGTAGLGAWIGLKLGRFVYPGTDATIICLLGVMLVLSQLGARGWGNGWFAWRPFVLVGQISYGIYLWQQLFLGPLLPGIRSIRIFPVGLLATLAVATASYKFLEKPLLRLKDREFHKAFVEVGSPLNSSGSAPRKRTAA
jgi:peptidoglycan/LPS O-acetylase OafA/YrhL